MKRVMSEIRPNIMLFIPFGIFTPLVFKGLRKWYMTALVSFMVTFCIEFFQYFIGRSCDVDDLTANVLGGIIGYVIFKILDYLLKSRVWWKKFTGRLNN